MRFAPVDPEGAVDAGAVPLRAGAGMTVVVEPDESFRHVAGPVYWLKPSAPEDLGYAECATCGQYSKPYTARARRHAQAWAHRHRCPAD